MLGWLGKLIAGPLFTALGDAYKARLAADNDESRMVADVLIKDIERQIAERQAAKEIRLATAGYWEMRVLAFFGALPFIAHAVAVGMDTIFKLGWRIPAFPAPFDQYQGEIIIFFFGAQVALKGITAFSTAIRRR